MRSLFRPIPARLLDDARFMRLDSVASDLLMRLYLVCDRRGRGSADPHLVRSSTGRLHLSTEDVEAALQALSKRPSSTESALLRVYPDTLNGGWCWQLDRYWADLTEDMRRKAGVSRYPDPAPELDDQPAPFPFEEEWAPSDEDIAAAMQLPEDTARAPLRRPDSAPTAPYRHRQDVDLDKDGHTRVSGARAYERGREEAIRLAGPSSSWPTAKHEQAGVAWRDELWRRSPMNGHHLVTLDAIAAIASMFPDTFCDAVAESTRQGAAWGGWTARWPLNWLRKGCEIASRPPPRREGTRRATRAFGHERADEEPAVAVSLEDFEAQLGDGDYDGRRWKR